MADSDQQVQTQPPEQQSSAPAPSAPTHNEMPTWATDLHKRMDELAGAVAKLPEQAVNAVREATQPARPPRQRSAPKTAVPKTEPAEQPKAADTDTSQPGKSGGFAQWWFGE